MLPKLMPPTFARYQVKVADSFLQRSSSLSALAADAATSRFLAAAKCSICSQHDYKHPPRCPSPVPLCPVSLSVSFSCGITHVDIGCTFGDKSPKKKRRSKKSAKFHQKNATCCATASSRPGGGVRWLGGGGGECGLKFDNLSRCWPVVRLFVCLIGRCSSGSKSLQVRIPVKHTNTHIRDTCVCVCVCNSTIAQRANFSFIYGNFFCLSRHKIKYLNDAHSNK